MCVMWCWCTWYHEWRWFVDSRTQCCWNLFRSYALWDSSHWRRAWCPHRHAVPVLLHGLCRLPQVSWRPTHIWSVSLNISFTSESFCTYYLFTHMMGILLWRSFSLAATCSDIRLISCTLPYLTLPSGWAGCYTCPALRPYQFGPMRNPDVTIRSQWSAMKPKSAVKPKHRLWGRNRLWSRTNHQPLRTGDV